MEVVLPLSILSILLFINCIITIYKKYTYYILKNIEKSIFSK